MSNITIKITADTTQLNSQLAIAKAQFAATQKALNELAKEAQKNGLSDGLKADMAKASSAMLQAQNSVSRLKTELTGLKPPQNFNTLLAQALSVGTFLAFEQVASQAMHVVESAFDATIAKAEQFALSNAKFAAQLGIDTTTATGLSAALKGVGSSTDEYATMALKLDRQLKTNEHSLNYLGMATRGQNGNLLDGKALMESAISTMEKYKAGTDQNEFALLAFGRGAKDVYDIMRVTDEQQKTYIEDMKVLGVATGTDAVEAAIKLEEEQARLKQQFEDVKVALGQHLMPTITAFVAQLNDSGAAKAFEDGIKGVAEASMEASALIAVAMRIIEVSIREATDVAIGAGEAAFKASLGDWSGAADAASNAWTHMSADASNFSANVGNVFDQLDADITRFEQGVAGSSAKSPFPSGNKGYVAPPDFKAQAAAAKRALEEQARDRAEFDAQMNAMSRDDLATTQQIEKLKLQTAAQTAEQEYQIGAITADEKFAILASAAQKEHDLTVQALNDDMKRSDTTIQQANHDANQILVIDEQLKERQAALARQLTQDRKAELQKQVEAYRTAFSQIKSAEDSFVSDMFSGQVSLGSALRNVAKQFAEEEIKADLHALTAHLLFNEQQLAADKALGEAGVLFEWLFGTQKAAAKETGNATATATSIAAAKTQALAVVPAETAMAAMGAASAVAPIPIVGPALAAAAAASMEALGASELALASAAGGEWNVPRDNALYKLHARESVLPANIAEPMREFFKRGGSGGGDVHHHTWNFRGDIGRVISDPSQRRALQNFIQNAMRNSV